MNPERVQRVESALLAVLVLVVAIVIYPEWWWVTLAAFLLFAHALPAEMRVRHALAG